MKKILLLILIILLLAGCGPTSPPEDVIRYGFYNCSKYTVKLVYYIDQYEIKNVTIVKADEKIMVGKGLYKEEKIPTKTEIYKVNNDSEELCHTVVFNTPKDIIGFDDGVVYEDKMLREVDPGGEKSDTYTYYLYPNLDSDVWK